MIIHQLGMDDFDLVCVDAVQFQGTPELDRTISIADRSANIMPFGDQLEDCMTAKKSGASGYENLAHSSIFSFPGAYVLDQQFR